MGRDCPCCRDRWHRSCKEVAIEKYRTDGYVVSVYDGIYKSTVDEWYRKYGTYKIVDIPHFKTSTHSYVGTIKFDTVEEYAQYLANESGWTIPDARIFYKNGEVKEINYEIN